MIDTTDVKPVVPKPKVSAGDKVWYVPDLCHQLDTDHQGNMLFKFRHASDGRAGKHGFLKGQPVANFGVLGRGRLRKHGSGSGLYRTGGGHLVEVDGPGQPWPAIVREVFADGSVALDIAHPYGGSLLVGHDAFQKGTFITLHYPLPGAQTGLPYSQTGAPHSWHLLADGA